MNSAAADQCVFACRFSCKAALLWQRLRNTRGTTSVLNNTLWIGRVAQSDEGDSAGKWTDERLQQAIVAKLKEKNVECECWAWDGAAAQEACTQSKVLMYTGCNRFVVALFKDEEDTNLARQILSGNAFEFSREMPRPHILDQARAKNSRRKRDSKNELEELIKLKKEAASRHDFDQVLIWLVSCDDQMAVCLQLLLALEHHLL